ncbi:MAG TPA: ribonuclease R [Verrucomicrobiae bacterium]|jgi:ribonuclease R|nr:ribonuclease R [Verrucomicrobiae bacterium]
MEEQVLKLLGQADYAPSNVPALLRQLNWAPHRQQELQRVLQGLEQAGRIARTKGNRYILALEADLVPGRLRMNRQGKGFLLPDDSSLKEIMVPETATGTAMHDDRVLVRRDVKPGARRDEGEQETGSVIRILERKRMQMVGTLQRGRQFLYVIPDDPRMPKDIIVPQPRDVGRPANIGDKVVVELHEWESRNINPEGEIIEVLGSPDEEGVDMLSVLRQYNMPLHFPKNVLQEARAIGTTVQPNEIAGREDCRSHTVVTIDPDDAKDFDDAICLQRISTEQWKLWVHIADVSHYVKPGTALDIEARERGNSTYLVDRVIPMLPEALSNELCSLKPNVDRLTKCVEFLLSSDGRVLSSKSYPAVIHSKRRFTYKEVLAVLERKPTDAIERMLHDANEMAQKIRKLRFKAGSLDLDFPETKIRLDDHGQILRIEKIENDISHQLIEEYMLLANEAVARQLMRANIPAIYRVHEDPDERRLRDYREEVLSHHVPVGNLTKRPEVQKLLQKLGTISIGAALKIGFLRSLMRARYAIEPLGHYGLAKKEYAHFTSPIRRYADLVVHRALFNSGHGSQHSLKQTAEHISDTERNSADAERDSKDVKLYAFLRAQLKSANPPRYTGLVTDVRNFGFFVDVSGLAMSGLVHLSSIEDDFFVFDASRAQLVGRRNHRVIRLGDKVEVQIAKIDQFKKQVDFRLARASKPEFKPASRPDSRPAPRPEQKPAPKPQPKRWDNPRPSNQKPEVMRTAQSFRKFGKQPRRR